MLRFLMNWLEVQTFFNQLLDFFPFHSSQLKLGQNNFQILVFKTKSSVNQLFHGAVKSENMFQTQLGPKILAIMATLPQRCFSLVSLHAL